jgi:uncharacterized radical SAM superfamily Fe-S cluster-containing enzyme
MIQISMGGNENMTYTMSETVEHAGRKMDAADADPVLPGRTQSLCPECLTVIDAVLYEDDDRVWMRKHCSRHGTFTELINSDAAFYRLQIQRDRAVIRPVGNPLVGETRTCPEGCGLCAHHLSGPCHRQRVEDEFAAAGAAEEFADRGCAL